jgi:hypothetical protein
LTLINSGRFAKISLIDFLDSIGFADDNDLVKGSRNNYIEANKTIQKKKT